MIVNDEAFTLVRNLVDNAVLFSWIDSILSPGETKMLLPVDVVGSYHKAAVWLT